jgi:hypothetical protein
LIQRYFFEVSRKKLLGLQIAKMYGKRGAQFPACAQ